MDNDPGPLVAAFSAVLPQPYATWLAMLVGIASIACSASSLFRAWVPPPVAGAPRWWLAAYQALSWPAANFGWARNAVVPGMPAPVREAALLSAKLTAAAPGLTIVAATPAVQGAITLGEAAGGGG